MTLRSTYASLLVLLLSVPACESATTGEPAPLEIDATMDTTLSTSTLVINELAARGEPADWIEIYNGGSEPVELGGWTLTDRDPIHTHVFPGGQFVAPGAYKLFLRAEAGAFTFGLGAADSVALYDGSGSLVDRVDWEAGDCPLGTSYGRIPNGTGSFQTLINPTPASENVANPAWICGDGSRNLGEVCDGDDLQGAHCEAYGLAGQGLACASDCQSYDISGCAALSKIVVVNEVSSTGDDPIELLNPGSEAVNLSGWTLTDETEASIDGAYVFAEGSELLGGDYLVLLKDSDHLFGLGGADSVRLRDSSGLLIDELTWPSGGAALSFCRIPNGSGAGQVCDAASLGVENVP